MLNRKNNFYKKKNSFLNISASEDVDYKKILNEISNLDISLDQNYTQDQKKLFFKIKKILIDQQEEKKEDEFKLTKNIADELEVTEKRDYQNIFCIGIDMKYILIRK